MRARQEELAAAGARLVLVGTGTPAQATAFAGEHGGGHPVLTDPQRRVFAQAGMRRGLLTTLRLRLLPNVLRALRAGFRPGRVQGDPWQQGGIVVLDRDGALLHRQIDGTSGDLLDLDAVLSALGTRAVLPNGGARRPTA